MSSWTDIFLIPFKVSLEQTKSMFGLKCSESEITTEYNYIDMKNKYKDSIELRKNLLEKIAYEIIDYPVDVLHLMIFGTVINLDLSDNEAVLCLRGTTKKFISEDTAFVDTIDKILIEQFIAYLDGQLEENCN